MKKFIALTLACTMALSMNTAVFADTMPESGAVWTPNPGHNTPALTNPDTVPMYGYIGPVVDNPTDPDPDDPDINPWNPLNLSVPVKFMWAAFEPDESDNFDPATDVVPIESPTYLIINHSKDKDIQIDVDKFITETALATDVGTLQIDLIPEALKTPGTDTIKGIQLLDHGDTIDYSVTDLDLGKITKAVSDMDNGINGTEIENIWKFTIGGEFKVAAGEEWPEQLQLPEYTVEFKFAATDAL